MTHQLTANAALAHPHVPRAHAPTPPSTHPNNVAASDLDVGTAGEVDVRVHEPSRSRRGYRRRLERNTNNLYCSRQEFSTGRLS